MTNLEMARGHLRQAQRILEEAGRHHEAGAWHLVVRRCQEAVELALKAALRFYGDEEVGAPADRLYAVQDAEDALRDARVFMELCERYVGG